MFLPFSLLALSAVLFFLGGDGLYLLLCGGGGYGVYFPILVFVMWIITDAVSFLRGSNNQYYTITEELFSSRVLPSPSFGNLETEVHRRGGGSLGLRDRAPLGRRRAADRSCERGGRNFLSGGVGCFASGFAFWCRRAHYSR